MSVKCFGKITTRNCISGVFLLIKKQHNCFYFYVTSIVEEGLSYRFHASWPFVLQILGCFYRAAGKQAHPIMTKVKFSLI